LQTLHPTKFDHGQILAQTPLPGIPVPKNATVSVLKDVLSDAGAFMLRDVIESGAFLTPFKPISHTAQDIDLITNGKGVARAPKTTKADTEIHWSQMTASEILHRFRISDGYGWDQTAYGTLGEEKCRIIYISLKETTPDLTRDIDPNLSPGVPCFLSGDSERDRRRIGVKAKDGVVLEVVNCKVAGRGTSSGMNELCRLLEHRGG
jgi:methionyl-tRNA formyltransferase